MADEEKLIRVKAAAKRLDMGVQTVYRLIYAGVLTAVDTRLPTAKRSSLRVPESAIEQMIADRKFKVLIPARSK